MNFHLEDVLFFVTLFAGDGSGVFSSVLIEFEKVTPPSSSKHSGVVTFEFGVP